MAKLTPLIIERNRLDVGGARVSGLYLSFVETAHEDGYRHAPADPLQERA